MGYEDALDRIHKIKSNIIKTKDESLFSLEDIQFAMSKVQDNGYEPFSIILTNSQKKHIKEEMLRNAERHLRKVTKNTDINTIMGMAINGL